jgi:hypothetical protein
MEACGPKFFSFFLYGAIMLLNLVMKCVVSFSAVLASSALAEPSQPSSIPVDVKLCPASITFSKLAFEAKGISRHMNNEHYVVALQALQQTELTEFSLNLVSTGNGQCRYTSTNPVAAAGLISKRSSTVYGEDGVPGQESWDRLMLRVNIEDSEFLAFFSLYPNQNRLEIYDSENRQTLSTPLTAELPRVGYMRYSVSYR